MEGHRWGLPIAPGTVRRRVEEVLDAVGALPYADAPVGMLSGGEQQRVRITQALATDPRMLLRDEPLLYRDLQHQRAVTDLVDRRRRSAGTAVVFVTHEINPVLGMVDRVLYLAPGGFRIGPPDEVMTTTALSELYGTHVDVLRVRGRIVVVGRPTRPTCTTPRAQPTAPAALPAVDGHDRTVAAGRRRCGRRRLAADLQLRRRPGPETRPISAPGPAGRRSGPGRKRSASAPATSTSREIPPPKRSSAVILLPSPAFRPDGWSLRVVCAVRHLGRGRLGNGDVGARGHFA
ncbi:ATP-binding cassette domain-containing protein [Streptomyces subrutilus]|uniref:ABC transporter domain-containing protein n=1 Tax=Streptomyces subrutilus TaxID=36818 RepID=A0A1E5Q0G2_9ACTN|nr:ATP-binding cassette domain-containing protein [Streptomyces subrutilus]OEJ35261.1 hypothetical protein BGK67_31705 [Streptomyces subrutilus]